MEYHAGSRKCVSSRLRYTAGGMKLDISMQRDVGVSSSWAVTSGYAVEAQWSVVTDCGLWLVSRRLKAVDRAPKLLL